MKLQTLISGGQTGADQAALDAAIKLSIPHGGWIPKGRLTENGPLSDKYQLEEMPIASYPNHTKQNVIDSDGTLIVSHGMLTGGSTYTREISLELKRPWLHIDLNKTGVFDAALKLSGWVLKINKHGVIYIAETGSGTIYAYKSGQLDSIIDGLSKPDQLAVDKEGALWISEDATPGRLLRYYNNRLETIVDGLWAPQGILVDEDSILVAEQKRDRIIRVSKLSK